ncbi:hypothetical protein F5884DRAFT_452697 [Xylogone sp. PMI_703]|nr:hypothetical protein F5884DRAFT_452697 [Xylogone sp. PMI_703]
MHGAVQYCVWAAALQQSIAASQKARKHDDSTRNIFIVAHHRWLRVHPFPRSIVSGPSSLLPGKKNYIMVPCAIMQSRTEQDKTKTGHTSAEKDRKRERDSSNDNDIGQHFRDILRNILMLFVRRDCSRVLGHPPLAADPPKFSAHNDNL